LSRQKKEISRLEDRRMEMIDSVKQKEKSEWRLRSM
jgi:hypothetical protein